MAAISPIERDHDYVVISYSIRPDQRELIGRIADEVELHGNRSLVVREAIDAYIAANRANLDAIDRGARAKVVIVHE